ncbi:MULTISPECIES: hypothetical protein [unclassified Rhizobium]|uniref:hypothetical protein n=1 Tax=unclassified Rhizobium TaxID=2613769 RepID=UPI0006F41E57|nr:MULTISPECIES: hypothetical protein [unclassified Rhizobium]KQV37668.1 hypothetical protein ASC86_23890 [Rhizobium sp. Root1212]KRD34570.1 hypothetical protein ASE37_22460 [Rhizobium sp. Root268]
MHVRISPPQQPINDPDVTLECEHAIDGAVRELVDQAVTAGWSPEVTFAAIKRVTDRQARAYQEDPDPADDAVEARPRTGFSLAPF